ncbi:uncharacterized protein LOC126738248 [Anthonomus grandis grandis]|uniref:uncharacterized protein LOC126738248 n=1 Tax=Anthonomus grandis grandis TaxID=2921223 RepID=UPI00216600BF|nr:uncharacterized protein LOC126738248 [Anthonomus grandis grandis]
MGSTGMFRTKMNGNYSTKVPINLPKLNVKTSAEKTLELLLKPVKEFILPSDSESDRSSEIIDAFEEFHRNSFLRPLPGTKRKFLTKQEADWKTVEQFTEDFKETLREIRKEMGLPIKLSLENEHEIEEELKHSKNPFFLFNTRVLDKEEPILVEREGISSETTSSKKYIVLRLFFV